MIALPIGVAMISGASSQVRVYIGPAIVDVCPNISGIQATLPAGMEVDINGDCYTPTPPPEPELVDLCSNLTGAQVTLPIGFYRTPGGLCYEQPAPPVDVCLNITGIQTAVPEGLYLDMNNTCLEPVVPAHDECFNIAGPQAVIPDGMKQDAEHGCYTPDAPPTGTTTPSPPAETPTATSYKNVPDALTPVVEPFVNLVPEPTKQWLRALPESVAKTTPYYIFVILGFVAAVPLLQSIREAMFVRQLRIILKKERAIAEEKENFIALASHYLRTPLTLMKNGLDTMVALKEVLGHTVKPLSATLKNLGVDIDAVLTDIEENKTLKNIAPPVFADDSLSITRSRFFWGPIVFSLVLTMLANFLLGVVGDKEIGGVNIFLQTIVAGVAVVALYTALRNLYLQKKLHRQNEQLLAHEQVVDAARNQFIHEATVTLRDGIAAIDKTKDVIANAPSAKFFEEGYYRFQAILDKFLLLGQVQTGTTRRLETFNLREEVDALIMQRSGLGVEKNLTIQNNLPETFVRQNRPLFNFVLGSLIDNAIKFNKIGGVITLSAEPVNKTLKVVIADNGIGIATDKLDQLFKPFSRATSSVEFNYEGLGFSLFLDKIIMDYTGGSISATSSPNDGTHVILQTPLSVTS